MSIYYQVPHQHRQYLQIDEVSLPSQSHLESIDRQWQTKPDDRETNKNYQFT